MVMRVPDVRRSRLIDATGARVVEDGALPAVKVIAPICIPKGMFPGVVKFRVPGNPLVFEPPPLATSSTLTINRSDIQVSKGLPPFRVRDNTVEFDVLPFRRRAETRLIELKAKLRFGKVLPPSLMFEASFSSPGSAEERCTLLGWNTASPLQLDKIVETSTASNPENLFLFPGDDQTISISYKALMGIERQIQTQANGNTWGCSWMSETDYWSSKNGTEFLAIEKRRADLEGIGNARRLVIDPRSVSQDVDPAAERSLQREMEAQARLGVDVRFVDAQRLARWELVDSLISCAGQGVVVRFRSVEAMQLDTVPAEINVKRQDIIDLRNVYEDIFATARRFRSINPLDRNSEDEKWIAKRVRQVLKAAHPTWVP